MQALLQDLLARARQDLAALRERPAFEAAKARFVGPNGELTALMKETAEKFAPIVKSAGISAD